MARTTRSAGWLARWAVLVGTVLALFVSPATRADEPSATSDVGEDGEGEGGYYLGVNLQNSAVYFPGYGPVSAVRITAVRPGTPALSARLEAGDTVVWANGRRVRNYQDFQDIVDKSKGTLRLSVVAERTGSYVTLAPITLAPRPEAARPEPAVATEADPEDDVFSAIEIPRFPIPPPSASARMTIPRGLVHKDGRDESLLDVARRLESGLKKAGYDQLEYYAVPSGFAIATRLEQVDAEGAPLPGPARWAAEVKAPRVFSPLAYLNALKSDIIGHFRVIVLVVQPEDAVGDGEEKEITRAQALTWLRRKTNQVPKELSRVSFGEDYGCTALIYEFERSLGGSAPSLVERGPEASTQLEKSNVLKSLSE